MKREIVNVVPDEDLVTNLTDCGAALWHLVDAVRDRVQHDWEPTHMRIWYSPERNWQYEIEYLRAVPLQRGER